MVSRVTDCFTSYCIVYYLANRGQKGAYHYSLAMPGLEGIGKMLIIIGITITGLGLLLTFGERVPFLGKLPGDILIRKDGISIYFPVVTLLLLSGLLTLIINIIWRLMGR